MSTKTKMIFIMSFLSLIIVGCVASMVIVLAAPKQNGILDVSIKYFVNYVINREESSVVGLTDAGKAQSELVVPSYITKIDSGAFSEGNAKSITIPSSVTTLEAGAFANNSVVETIVFEEPQTQALADSSALTTIPADTFKNCTNLKSLTLPGSVTLFDGAVLSGCMALQNLEFPYVLGNGANGASGLSKLFGTDNSSVPSSLQTIKVNGGTTISQYAFIGTIGLKSIWLPKTISSVATYSLTSCQNLEKIEIDEENLNYNSGNGANCIIKTTNSILVQGCKTTKIPDGVVTIGSTAFENVINLTSIVIPNSVGEILDAAFYNCYSLESITISNNLRIIGDFAFYYCKKLTTFTFPDKVTYIGSYAFRYCIGLSEIVLPKTLTQLNKYSFHGCSGLNSISFLNTTGWNYYDNNSGNYVSIDVTNVQTNATKLKEGEWIDKGLTKI